MSEIIVDLVDTPDGRLIASLTTMVRLGVNSFTLTKKQEEDIISKYNIKLSKEDNSDEITFTVVEKEQDNKEEGSV